MLKRFIILACFSQGLKSSSNKSAATFQFNALVLEVCTTATWAAMFVFTNLYAAAGTALGWQVHQHVV